MSPRIYKPSRKWRVLLEKLSRSVQYIYFMRFSLAFPVLLFLLARLDAISGVSSFTRGIFTPSTRGQFFGAAFFVVCLGMVALLTARLVCLNGQDRFLTRPPRWLRKTLGTASDPVAGRVLLFFQIPTAYVIYRLFKNALHESVFPNSVIPLGVIVGTLLGIAAAILFWMMIDAFYYWTFDISIAKTSARTLLFPRSWFGLEPIDQRIPTGQNKITLELDTLNIEKNLPSLDKLFDRLAWLGNGYADRNGHLWPGHRLATIAFLWYFVVYIFLFPLTSPTPQGYGYYVAFAGAGIFLGLLSLALYKTRSSLPGLKWFLFAVFAVISLLAFALLLHPRFSFQGFPVLGSVLVLFTMLCFIFASLAFWADRHRIPVFTTFVAYLFIIHLIPWGGDHYFRTPARNTPAAFIPSNPGDILTNHKCGQQKTPGPCPLIVVVASGGGIHAASWTATVLTQLERAMQSDPRLSQNGFTFHDNLFFISTVSGGSDGLVPFLREYYATTPFVSTQPTKDEAKEAHISPNDVQPYWAGRINRAANCSSLEAVGWGLEYSDFLHIVFPLPVSLDWDRSAALERAFARNILSPKCDPLYSDENSDGNTKAGQQNRGLPPLNKLTLARMAYDLQHPGETDSPRHLPAFTLNTTAAETGGRFILGNYINASSVQDGVVPAESFLAAYSREETRRDPLDLQLATAARLSATFPYVSSAARIQDTGHWYQGDKLGADHFVDGGYYDNDGTASAIEFLSQAFLGARLQAPVPILFVEIRDGADLDTAQSDESFANQNQSHLKKNDNKIIQWTLRNQLSAPLGAFWAAGHSSVTRRDRRELELLMRQLAGKAEFTHIVFDYNEPPDTKSSTDPAKDEHRPAQPLSWHLTPSEMNSLAKSMNQLNGCVWDARAWADYLVLSDTKPQIEVLKAPEVICNYSFNKMTVPSAPAISK